MLKSWGGGVAVSPMPPVDHLQLVSSYAHVVFAVCAFPYILAFTTDSIEIRLVVNGNLVYTAVVPELQLAASRVSIIDSQHNISVDNVHCNFVNNFFYLYSMSKSGQELDN